MAKKTAFEFEDCMVKGYGLRGTSHHGNIVSVRGWLGCGVPQFCPNQPNPTPVLYHLFMPVPCTLVGLGSSRSIYFYSHRVFGIRLL